MSLSTFPTIIDSFNVKTAISATDITDMNTYKSLVLNPSRTPTQNTQLNALITTLNNKLILPDDINKTNDCITNLEAFVNSVFLNYYQYKGIYNNTTIYTQFNSVKYTDGNTYLLYTILPSYVAGIIPTNTSYWIQIGAKGDVGVTGSTGASGVGLVYKGAFNPSSTYSVNDCVTYSGNAYACILIAPAGKYPNGVDGATYWVMFISGGGAVGDVSTLNTVVKDTAVNAINEVNNKTGILSGLPTVDKSNLVNAITEIHSDAITDANNLTSHLADIMPHQSGLNSYASVIDGNGIYTIVDYKRADTTLYMKSTLSGGTSPKYTTDTWQFYDTLGTTIIATKTWTMTYDASGKVITKVVV